MTAWISRRTVLATGTAALVPLSPLLAGGEAQNHTIEISKFKFEPATLTANPGDTITWINRDIVPHTATANDKIWDTGTLKKDESIVTTVGEDTIGAYFCRFHPHMKGELKISDNGKS